MNLETEVLLFVPLNKIKKITASRVTEQFVVTSSLSFKKVGQRTLRFSLFPVNVLFDLSQGSLLSQRPKKPKREDSLISIILIRKWLPVLEV